MIYLYAGFAILVFVALVGCPFFLMRNELVHHMRIKAIGIVSARNQRLIDEGQFELTSWSEYENAASHASMIYDLRKWKFEHFFPELNLASANCERKAT